MELLDGCSLAELISQHRRPRPGARGVDRPAGAGGPGGGPPRRHHPPRSQAREHPPVRAIRGQWTIKLMDFGISKFAQDPNTAAGATLGTPHYMAPEQIHGAANVDARADLWSVGVILYESMTGVQLFARETLAGALVALRTFDPAAADPAPAVGAARARGGRRQVPRARAREALGLATRWPRRSAPFERMGPKTAETAAKATTERRAAGAAPKALAQQQQQPVARGAGAAGAAGGRSSLGAAARAGGRLAATWPCGQVGAGGTGRARTRRSAAAARLAAHGGAAVGRAGAASRRSRWSSRWRSSSRWSSRARSRPRRSRRRPKPAAKQVAKSAKPAAGRGVAAPRRGRVGPTREPGLLIGVLLAVFGGLVALVVGLRSSSVTSHFQAFSWLGARVRIRVVRR
jgi:hypothetical protein